jgi:hypothetical protein
MRKATACAVLAVLAAAGCSAGQSSSTAALSTSTAPASLSSPGLSPASTAPGLSPAATASEPGPAQPSAAPGTPVGPSGAGPSGTGAKPVTVDGNITIDQAAGLKPGPLAITPLYCGKLSTAQQQQFGTTAAGGLVYRYANHSGTSTAGPNLYVGFTDGTSEAGANYGGNQPSVAPGQSAEGEVDAVGITNQDLTFSGCDVMSYALDTPSGVDPVSYAG